MKKTYHLYISYSWQCHLEACKKKVEFLDKSGISYKFLEPFKMENSGAEHIDRHIEKIIKFSDCLLMIAGVDEKCDAHLEKEIDYAKKHRKPIIAIAPWSNKKDPNGLLLERADKVIGWHAKLLADAILSTDQFH